MGLPKFDDISKTASAVLGDDFQCKDFQLKTKQKTHFDGAVAEVTVDLFPQKGDAKTPAKLNLKFPKPFAFLPGFAIDKFELSGAGAYKVECSASEKLHKVNALKLELKGDLTNQTVAATYTGIADASVKIETKNFSTTDFNAEVIYGGIGAAVIGAKFNGPNVPAVGVSYAFGDIFTSVIAKNTFSEFTIHTCTKVNSSDASKVPFCKLHKVAATYQHGGKTNGNWSVGGSAAVGDITAKVKVDQDMTASVAFKKDLAKDTTLFGGVNYNINSSAMGYGAKVNIE